MSEILSNVSNSEPDPSDSETESNCVENSSSSEYDDYYLEKEEAAHQRQLLLQERLLSLQETMTNLRNQLQEERSMWKKEVDEITPYYPLPQYRGYNMLEPDLLNDMNNSNANLREFNLGEYEQQLTLYQEALARAQSERRMALQKQIAMSNYKRRLLEIESMCNLELMRVKQSVQWLAPLQKIASEWNRDLESGDAESRSGLCRTESEESFKRSLKESMDAMDGIGKYDTKALSVYPLDLTKVNSTTSIWQNCGDFAVATSSSCRLYLDDLAQEVEKKTQNSIDT